MQLRTISDSYGIFRVVIIKFMMFGRKLCRAIMCFWNFLVFFMVDISQQLNSLRNQLLASSEETKDTRVVHVGNELYFGLKWILSQRKEKRTSNRGTQVADLSMNYVQPDSWNKILMTFAEYFSDKLTFYSILMKCNNDFLEIKLTEVEVRSSIFLSTKQSNLRVTESCKPGLSFMVRTDVALSEGDNLFWWVLYSDTNDER